MIDNFKPITPKFPHILHGGDYNPEQWKDYPEVLQKDIELFKKANINCVSLGIFSWANLEPQKDIFTFDWLDTVMDTLYKNGIYTVLATPSGSRPQWLAKEYPEVLRVNQDGKRNLYGNRHNHCYTSPKYRQRVKIIDTKLAERYANNPAVILWHISNEFSGDCHCELCQNAFRNWLKEKYQTLDNLNHAWWSHFWSHTYTNWQQLHSPSYLGETSIQGLNLDWKRFVTYQTIDFMQSEIDTVKSINKSIPVTTNFMGIYFDGLDYYKFKDRLDVISWDSYPEWHNPNNSVEIARNESLSHDMMRSIKKMPFLLMECTPSTTNWRNISKLKKPNMHELSVIHAIAHGSNSGQYFQLRQSRGSVEKFHSAVISHTGTENTRVFKEVSKTGLDLKIISNMVYNSRIDSKVAIIYDVENKWAIDNCQGPRNLGLDYFKAIQNTYNYFWKNGINVDILDSEYSFDDYKIIIAPMLYMFRCNIQDRLREFVKNGGILLTTAFSGVVNDTDLCFLGEDTQEKLSDVFGMWVEELDALYDNEYNQMSWNGKDYKLKELCEIIHPTTCETLAVYQKDFYKDTPVLTKNRFGKGLAYHVCSNADVSFFDDFLKDITKELNLERALDFNLPEGVVANYRTNDDKKIVFIQNFTDKKITININKSYVDIISNKTYLDEIPIDSFSFVVIC